MTDDDPFFAHAAAYICRRTDSRYDDPDDGDDPRQWTDEYAVEYAQAVAADRGEVWTAEQVAEYVQSIRLPTQASDSPEKP